jgi:3-methyladenine DNA glycosylase AlkD
MRQVRAALRRVSRRDRAAALRLFFKTGPGEYGEGDRFIGVTVPDLHRLARQYGALPLADVRRLLRSPVNEERSLALMILVRQFQRGDAEARDVIFHFYMRHLPFVNNWNLVDGSARCIIGPHLMGRDTRLLDRLARSRRMWDRRIAIVSTYHFITHQRYAESLRVARLLLRDEHDLIHKACGWMLREVGKRDPTRLHRFLRTHARRMPRTMLRYAIERFPEKVRRGYLRGDAPPL